MTTTTTSTATRPDDDPEPTDDIFLLRAVKCIDTDGDYGVGLPPCRPAANRRPRSPTGRRSWRCCTGRRPKAARRLPQPAVGDEDRRRAADQLRHGAERPAGGLRPGGNDAFFVDDNSAITTLDGGEGFDTFQIGQIFGPSATPKEGALLPHDTFPVLIATTRGWLSPGTHAPLVATGGTGNDEFTVYSNQAELRLEGDDDNDLFVVRAFALAAVCDTERGRRRRLRLRRHQPRGRPGHGRCSRSTATATASCNAAENPGYDGEGWTGFRRDNNGDGVCNKADAHITGGDRTTRRPALWEDDVIPLDADGVARPIIGLGFSTARPLDIRAGGGEDEVSYNVNAPVSVDGGTGFDKVAVLGTEFADDIVISVRGIFGAGLNVRYDEHRGRRGRRARGRRRVLRHSTKFGVAYRVIGGLGSDTINVAGDVVEDIVTRELEGVSGAIDHRVTSQLDRLYDGLPVDGIDYNLATPDAGVVIIDDEGPEGTSVREGGSVSVGEIDSYSIRLASDPGDERVRHDLGRPLAAGGGRRRVLQPRADPDEQLADRRRGRHDLALHRPGPRAPTRPTSSASSGSTACSSTRPTARSSSVRRQQLERQAVGLRARGRRSALRGRSRRRGPALDDLRQRGLRRGRGPQRRGVAARQRHAGHLRHRDQPGLLHAASVRGGQAQLDDRGRAVRPRLHRARATSCSCSCRRTRAPRRSASSSCWTPPVSRRSS